MFVFYLITLLYGSNSLYTEMTNVLSANKTLTKERKKHSILDVLKSDPQMFISEVQNLDPASIKHIISLLEELRAESETRENEFVTALTDAQTALDQSNQDLIDAVDVLNTAKGERDTAQGVVDDANVVLNEKKTAVDSALAAHGATEDNHESKTTERNDAQTALDDEKPSLDDEQQILTDVINLMTGLHDKHYGRQGDALYAEADVSQRMLKWRGGIHNGCGSRWGATRDSDISHYGGENRHDTRVGIKLACVGKFTNGQLILQTNSAWLQGWAFGYSADGVNWRHHSSYGPSVKSWCGGDNNMGEFGYGGNPVSPVTLDIPSDESILYLAVSAGHGPSQIYDFSFSSGTTLTCDE